MNEKLRFYTLLHLKSNDLNENFAENNKANILGYLKCCEVLNQSLNNQGYSLSVLTNDDNFLQSLSKKLTFQYVDFNLDVPKDIKFYSAHFKIDVYKFLSQYGSEYSILIDSDVVCLNPMPLNMKNLIESNIPLYYDITNQRYPAYGREKILFDKQLIMETKSSGNWAGGEFIGGNKLFFKELYLKCLNYWPNYKENYQNIQHQGDEMLTSCALEKFQTDNNFIFNINTIGGISRFWSSNTLHKQKPISAHLDNFLIHLPNDKLFINKINFQDSKKFIKAYLKYLTKIKIINFAKKIIT